MPNTRELLKELLVLLEPFQGDDEKETNSLRNASSDDVNNEAGSSKRMESGYTNKDNEVRDNSENPVENVNGGVNSKLIDHGKAYKEQNPVKNDTDIAVSDAIKEPVDAMKTLSDSHDRAVENYLGYKLLHWVTSQMLKNCEGHPDSYFDSYAFSAQNYNLGVLFMDIIYNCNYNAQSKGFILYGRLKKRSESTKTGNVWQPFAYHSEASKTIIGGTITYHAEDGEIQNKNPLHELIAEKTQLICDGAIRRVFYVPAPNVLLNHVIACPELPDKLLKPLLHEGIVNKGSGQDVTPMHVAAKYGRKSICKDLIKAGARVAVYDVLGILPLHNYLEYVTVHRRSFDCEFFAMLCPPVPAVGFMENVLYKYVASVRVHMQDTFPPQCSGKSMLQAMSYWLSLKRCDTIFVQAFPTGDKPIFELEVHFGYQRCTFMFKREILDPFLSLLQSCKIRSTKISVLVKHMDEDMKKKSKRVAQYLKITNEDEGREMNLKQICIDYLRMKYRNMKMQSWDEVGLPVLLVDMIKQKDIGEDIFNKLALLKEALKVHNTTV